MRFFRPWIAAAALASGVLAGCHSPEPASDCDAMVEEARALVAEHARCSAADACSIIWMSDYAGANNCVLPLQVLAAVRANTDLDELSARAHDLVQRYNAACTMCASAAAQDPARLIATCDGAAERCVLVPR